MHSWIVSGGGQINPITTVVKLVNGQINHPFPHPISLWTYVMEYLKIFFIMISPQAVN